jgi:hypothetical protein
LLDAGEQKKKEEMMRAAVFHGAFDIQVEQIPDVVRLQILLVTSSLLAEHISGERAKLSAPDQQKIARTASQYERERSLNPFDRLLIAAAFWALWSWRLPLRS